MESKQSPFINSFLKFEFHVSKLPIILFSIIRSSESILSAHMAAMFLASAVAAALISALSIILWTFAALPSDILIDISLGDMKSL